MGPLRVDSSGSSSVYNSSSSTPPSNDDIEAVIQMATSDARASLDGRAGPLRDTRTQLFVGNLPYRVRWQDLKDLFRKAGTVLRADVSLGADNRSRGYGTVLLATAEDAGRAVEMFNGYSWQTRILEVRPDRLPPDFDNPLGVSLALGFGNGVSSVPNALGASPFGPQGHSLTILGTTMDEVDYSAFYPHEGMGSSLVGGKNLFVGNLPFHCQWQDLKDLFRQAGTIIRADVALGPDGRSRGFGTVIFATDMDAERAVKMFNGYEYNGRLLKVHYDKFSQASQPATAPTSPSLQPSFHHSNSFNPHVSDAPNNVPVPMGYHFDFGIASGPSSPYGGPPNLVIPQPHLSQAHPTPVDHIAASLQHTSLGGNGQSSEDGPRSGESPQQQPPHHPHPGPIALPPPPSVNAFPILPSHTLSPHAVSPLHHPMSPMHHPLMTPHGLPPITPSMPPFSFLPQPSPHGMSTAPSNMQNLNTPPLHAAHMLSTFSPGVAMSPGAFWGRPGGGVNPFINPTVGAPVHGGGSPGGFFGMNMHPTSPGHPTLDESGGYFPPVTETGYFPPMPPSSLANEILRDKSNHVDTPSSEATDTGTHDCKGGSSSTSTSWHTPDEEARLHNAAEKELSSSFLPDDSNEDALPDSPRVIARTNSMSTSGKTADRIPMPRNGSDPIPAHSRTQRNKIGEKKDSLDGISGTDHTRAGERRKADDVQSIMHTRTM